MRSGVTRLSLLRKGLFPIFSSCFLLVSAIFPVGSPIQVLLFNEQGDLEFDFLNLETYPGDPDAPLAVVNEW